MNADEHDETVWDAGLQPERTSLAWRRLALALLVLALAVPRVGWPVMGAWALAPAGIAAAGALTLLTTGHRRYVNTYHVLNARSVLPLPDGRLPLVTVLAALTLGAVGIMIVAAR